MDRTFADKNNLNNVYDFLLSCRGNFDKMKKITPNLVPNYELTYDIYEHVIKCIPVYLGECESLIDGELIACPYGFLVTANGYVYPWYVDTHEIIGIWLEDELRDDIINYKYDSIDDLINIATKLRDNMSVVDPLLRDTYDCNDEKLKNMLLGI